MLCLTVVQYIDSIHNLKNNFVNLTEHNRNMENIFKSSDKVDTRFDLFAEIGDRYAEIDKYINTFKKTKNNTKMNVQEVFDSLESSFKEYVQKK